MAIIGGINLGNLTNYLFYFDRGNVDANWQGATKGFVGDVAVNGIVADERTSGSVPYAGTIYTNDTTLGAWQAIINQNIGQATGSTNQVARISGLQSDLYSAFAQINALPATPGFTSIASTALNGLNTQNGIDEVFVINVTSGFNFSTKINITGDAGDVYILRWDTDANPSNGYQGQVKPQSGGAIVPLGGLKASNFINVAGDIDSSGGGTTPAAPYPQGPRFNDGQGALIAGGSDFSGGGFFTGYWLTTGAPNAFDAASGLFIGPTHSLSNGIFVGGWYTVTTEFSMTSGTSGVYVSPNVVAAPSITVQKLVSADGGVTFDNADNPPGPNIPQGTNPIFRYIVTNNGNVTLTNVTLTDNKLGNIILPVTSLSPTQSVTVDVTGTWAAGQQTNIATASGNYGATTVTATNPANYVGVANNPSISLRKQVSPDNGTTFFDADTPPGPSIPQGTNPIFRYIVVNNGNAPLTNVTLVDNVLGPITIPTTTLAVGQSFTVDVTGTWALGLNTNTATVTGSDGAITVTDINPANYTGVAAAPAITVQKLVSPDGGITFDDANIPPGPSIPQGTNPIFRFIVTNTGNVPLSSVTLTDSVLGPIVIPTTTLAVGQSFTVDVTGTWATGLHTNTATTTGSYNATTVTDTDDANYTGIPATPAITVVKYVSPDNGLSFFDADVPPGPSIMQGTNPIFRYVVTNTGNTTLTNISLSDSVLGSIAIPFTTLAAGGSFTVDATGAWAAGQRTNLATVTGAYGAVTVTGTNPANYFGVAAEPAITLQKLVSADGGITFDDANTPPGPSIPSSISPIFRYIVRNTGNVTLTNVTLTDSVLGSITIPVTTLTPGQSFTVDRVGTWAVGQQVNVGTTTGQYQGTTVTDTDPAYYVGIAVPAIDVIKEVSADGGITFVDANTPPGPTIIQGTNPVFRYKVTNIGNVTLTNVTLTDSVLGSITIPTTVLTPGQSFTVTRTGTWNLGVNLNVATTTGLYGTIIVTDEDPAYYTGAPANPAIDLEKLVSPDGGLTFVDADTPPGPNIPQTVTPIFRYIVRNTGNVTLTNIVLTDNKLGVITTPVTTLAPNGFFIVDKAGTWQLGLQTNVAAVTGAYGTVIVTDTDPANYTGILVPTNFKQFSLDEILTIPSQKPDCEDILNTLVDVEITEKRVIKTMKGTSREGQILSGFKLIIEGVSHQKIEYIADEPTQTVHAAEFDVPFSSFIILPEDFVEGTPITVTPYVEDVYVKQLDKRHFFKNVTLRLEAVIND